MTTRFQCKICQKTYASKYSLANHKSIKKHRDTANISMPDDNNIISVDGVPANSIKTYKCKYCDKEYKHRQSKSRHQALCDNKQANAIRILNEKKQMHSQMKKIFYSKMQEYDKLNKNKLNENTVHGNIKNEMIDDYYDELNKLDNIYDKPNEIFALARLYNACEIDKLNNIYTSYPKHLQTGSKSVEEPKINPIDNNLSEGKSNITPTKKYIKNKIPKLLKNQSWDVYIGKEKGIGNCYCCNAEIDSKHFECGHIIPASKGGPETIENLRPICSLCNQSIGSKNMDEFIEKYIKKPIENL